MGRQQTILWRLTNCAARAHESADAFRQGVDDHIAEGYCKKYGEEYLTVHVGNVCKLEQLIDNLASEHKRLMAMFKAQSAQ